MAADKVREEELENVVDWEPSADQAAAFGHDFVRCQWAQTATAGTCLAGAGMCQ